MNVTENVNMISPRQIFEPTKHEKNYSQLKDALMEKEERIKELIDKNDKFEKDYLKMQVQVKNLEEKLKKKMENEYKVCDEKNFYY